MEIDRASTATHAADAQPKSRGFGKGAFFPQDVEYRRNLKYNADMWRPLCRGPYAAYSFIQKKGMKRKKKSCVGVSFPLFGSLRKLR